MPNSILVIEDELMITGLIAMNLQHAEHYPIRAYNAKQALSLMSDVLPNLILFDWVLPGKSGVMFIRGLYVNERTHQIPVIVLTARSERQSKIMGLDSGTDSYVTKPLSPKELLARIRAVLCRHAPQLIDDMVVINGLKLDPATHRAAATNIETENPIKLDLGLAELHLLHSLTTHPGCVHGRSQLLDRVWDDRVLMEERTMDVHVKRLRIASAPGGCSNIIRTVRDSDYCLARNPGQ